MTSQNKSCLEDFQSLIAPILFSLFPIISLFNYNKDILYVKSLVFPCFLSIFFCIVGYYFLVKIFNNCKKTSIFISLFIVIFYTVGHIGNIYGNIHVNFFDLAITTDILLILLFFVLIFIVFLIIRKSEKNFEKLYKVVKIIAIIGFFTPSIALLNHYVSKKKLYENDFNLKINEKTEIFVKKSKIKKPDIYYIVLDGYARKDVLEEIYGFDNRKFIENLECLGFYVAEGSRTNYAQTYLSVSSALNMDYLQNLQKTGEPIGNRTFSVGLIDQNAVFNNLKKYGYTIVSVSGTWTKENLYYDLNMKTREIGLNRFDNMLIKVTPFRLFKNVRLDFKRKAILNGFFQLGEIPQLDGPTFVYAHFLIPHPPFIFNEKGEAINPPGLEIETDGDQYLRYYPDLGEYRRRYVGQLEFVNRLVMETVEKILRNSKEPPIIVLQSDHGPGSMTRWEHPEKTNMKERMSIFNAYYFPGPGQKALYKKISPVNSFRLIFNSLFGEKNPLLADRSFFSTWSKPYEFIEIDEGNKIKN